jgi:GTPase SAR1 family protein
MTDLITNSSTVIYTYSDASLEACRKMIDEIFKTFGIKKTCDDVFDLAVVPESYDRYYDALSDLEEDEIPEELKGIDELPYKERDPVMAAYLKKVTAANDVPEWVSDAKDQYSDFEPSTMLEITPKAPEYEDLAKVVTNFLYSTGHDGGRDG